MKIARALGSLKPSYGKQILSAANSEGMISLAGGLPDEQSFPLHLIQAIMQKVTQDPCVFQYGTTEGYAPLLQFLHKYYDIQEHEVFICSGSQQGLDLIARCFIEPGETVVIEEPSYMGAIQVFELAQANILTVPQESDGPNLTDLEVCLANHSVKIFYAVPDFHNPTGVCWSLAKRKAVAHLCEQYNVTLVEDIPYSTLNFVNPAQPTVSSFCYSRSLVIRSFSKMATPGIRVGAVSGPSQWIQPLITLKQSADVHTSTPMQAMLFHLLQHEDFVQHLNNVRRLYADRYQVMRDAIFEFMPDSCFFKPVTGGMFIWLEFNNPSLNIEAIARESITNNVAVVPSTQFYPSRYDKVIPALRLNFTHTSTELLREGIYRLSKVIHQFS